MGDFKQEKNIDFIVSEKSNVFSKKNLEITFLVIFVKMSVLNYSNTLRPLL